MVFLKNSLKDLFQPFGGLCRAILPQQRASDDPTRREMLRRFVVNVDRSTPVAVGFNVVLTFLIGVALHGSVPDWQLYAWFTMMMAMAAAMASRGRVPDHAPDPSGRSLERWYRNLAIGSACRAAGWAAGIVVFFPQVDPTLKLLLGMSTVGLMSGGAFGLSMLPMVALLYSGILAVAGTWVLVTAEAWQLQILSLLMVAYFLYLATMVLKHGRSFADQTLAELNSTEQKQTIAMLLNEFEESSSDWLWRVDPEGRFVDVGKRFAEAAGREAEALSHMPFSTLFPADPEFYNVSANEHIRQRQPMHALIVGVDVGGSRRHWALSGSPQWDAEGAYLGYRGVAADVTDEVEAERRLRHLAHVDQLTGLVNRTRFAELLQQFLKRNNGEGLGLIVLDLNGLKTINDTLGHGTGDRLLAALGRRFSEWLGSQGIAARLGGDEFAMLLPNANSANDAMKTAQQLLALLDMPFEVPPHSLLIDAAAGVALTGLHGDDAESLLTSADVALQAAKSAGGRAARLFEASMGEAMRRRQAVETALQHAIDNSELSIRFHPIVSVAAGKVSGFEALLRWQSGTLGEVGPEEFVPIAEECGLIVPIGEWVLHEALNWLADFDTQTEIAVNVSPVQLRNSNIVATVRHALDESGLAPERLTIEITEGVLLDSGPHITQTLDALLGLGVRIALDDFGTGFSSLSYLKQFPFAQVKIDQSFVADMETSPANVQIIKAVINLAEALGFEVVAEGVRTHGQMSALTRLRCGYLQGYLFSAPLTADEVPAFIDRFGLKQLEQTG